MLSVTAPIALSTTSLEDLRRGRSNELVSYRWRPQIDSRPADRLVVLLFVRSTSSGVYLTQDSRRGISLRSTAFQSVR